MWKNMYLCFVVLTFLFTTLEVHGWESDTHYGLTKWLAVKAGFSLTDAEIIAAGAESADESNVLKASVIVPVYVCLGKSEEASRHVQQHHFPSCGFVRSPRNQRETNPGDPSELNAGNLWVRQVISTNSQSKNRKTKLNQFGQSLHALADSWSHQGKPDNPPLICSDDLVWSHSRSRGGWGSHDADITHKFFGDTNASAKASYHYMLKFLEKYSEYRYKPSVPWDKINERVDIFARAKTALEKKKWFDDNRGDVDPDSYTTYPCFLRSTSLEHHEKICPQEDFANADGSRLTGQLALQGTGEYSEFIGFFNSILNGWLIEKNVDRIIRGSFNVRAIKEGLIDDQPEWRDVNDFLWIKTLLLMWLVPDHGLVNELGHGLPYPNREGFYNLATKIVYERFLNFKDLSSAIYFPGTNQPYEIFSFPASKDGLRVTTVFSFVHTPRDTLIFIVSKVHGRWATTGMSWVIN